MTALRAPLSFCVRNNVQRERVDVVNIDQPCKALLPMDPLLLPLRRTVVGEPHNPRDAVLIARLQPKARRRQPRDARRPATLELTFNRLVNLRGNLVATKQSVGAEGRMRTR